MRGKKKKTLVKPSSKSIFKELVREWAMLFALCIAAILALFIAVALLPSEKPSAQIKSEPLYKNSQLKISPGESYAYNYSTGAYSTTITFSVDKWIGNCLRVVASSPQPLAEACISREGKFFYLDYAGANASGMDFFEEWMLALGENWSWKTEVEREIPKIGLAVKQSIQYNVVGVELFKGRKAFRVKARSFIGESDKAFFEADYLIDEEKRVLLAMNSTGASIELVQAPFKLS